MENLLHICFSREGADNLRKSTELDDILSGEILVFQDDLSIGPLGRRADQQGQRPRDSWCARVLGLEQYPLAEADAGLLARLRQQLREDPNSEAWIWIAQNSRDVCGYYWLSASLDAFQGRVHVLYLNNLPFLNEKGQVFFPLELGEIPPREFLKARKLAREITLAEFEMDAEEFRRLQAEALPVRYLEGARKLALKPEDAWDGDLLKLASLEYTKAWRLASQLRQKGRQDIQEAFLWYRLRELARADRLELKSEGAVLRDLEYRLASADPLTPQPESDAPAS